jgi:uncharacterized protein
MRKLIIAALLATGSITGQAMATEVHITATNPVIDLSVTEYVDTTPDVASFSTGVQTLALTANEAVRQNNMQMSLVIARLKKLGIADKDIQTTQISLNQQFDYNEGKQVFRGFEANNTVTAKLRDLKKLPQFLDALASDGATNFNGPAFSVDDDSKLKETARNHCPQSWLCQCACLACRRTVWRLWRLSHAGDGGARTIFGQGYAHCARPGSHRFDDEFHI